MFNKLTKVRRDFIRGYNDDDTVCVKQYTGWLKLSPGHEMAKDAKRMAKDG